MSDSTDIAPLAPVVETTFVSFEDHQALQLYRREFGPNPGMIIPNVVWDGGATVWDGGATVWIS